MNTRHSQERLVLNLSPVQFDDAEVRIGVFDYQDRELLQNLRRAYNETHVFLREGSQILSVPFVPGAEDVGDRFDTLQLKRNLRLCAALVRNALLNHLHKIRRPVYRYSPLRFVATGPQNNLLAKSLPRQLGCLHWLSVHPLFVADARVFHFDRQSPFVGIAFEVRTTRRIALSCRELLAENFSPIDLYVGRMVPHPDARIQPHLELLGRVQRIDDALLLLTDARPEMTSINASDAVLEPRLGAFDRCLTHVFGDQTERVKAALEVELTALRSGPTCLQKLRETAIYFAKVHLELVPGVAVEIAPLLSSDSRAFPPLDTASQPVYVFEPTGAHTDTWNDRGLKRYGPYTAQTFDKNRPRICVICQATSKGQVEQFLHKFFRGIPAHRNRQAPFEQGLVRKYLLEDVSTEFFVADDDTTAAYQRAMQKAITRQGDLNTRWDMALVQIEERFHGLHGEANPYLLTKMGFLTYQIPVQEFTLETMTLPDGQLGYALNNMALATYAKLGGIPWLIKASPTITHELVIGLGSASVGEGRLGNRKRVAGITTVFSGDGNYWLSNLTHSVPLAEYKEALLDSLRTTITKLRQSMNWQPRDHVRLVFHAFKPFKDTEAQAVKDLMTELGDYDIDYAFLHVIEHHPYVLFDEMQPGVPGYRAQARKGVLAPHRGRYLRLSRHEVLLILTGPRDVKRPEDGMPRPVLLRLHRTSSFKDMTYLARQVFSFACHSWRSFSPRRSR